MKYLLCICIASYNRKDVLIPDLKKYFSLEDTRFRVTVQDDGSNNGTLEELYSINDSRLNIRVNSHNLGALPNAKAALSNNDDCEYVMNLNDKDCIDIEVLPKFLDFLEKEKPNYGYVEVFEDNKSFEIFQFAHGVEAINNIGYTCAHPSGYFWKSELFKTETEKDYYKALNSKFDYQFDLLFAHCAVNYDGYKLLFPMITPGARREELNSVKSQTYSVDNLFFGVKERIKTFVIFLRDIERLHLPIPDKKICASFVYNRFSSFVTSSLRTFLKDKEVCFHYNLVPRTMTFPEMVHNENTITKVYLQETKSLSYGIRFMTIIKVYIKLIVFQCSALLYTK